MEKNPFEKALDQIADIMQFAYDHVDKPMHAEKMSEVEKNLTNLEKQIHDLKILSDDLCKKEGMTDYHYQALLEDSKGNSKDNSNDVSAMLKRAQFLKSAAESGVKNPKKAAQELLDQGVELTTHLKESDKKKKPKTRKGKFKSLGGYKNWTPL